LDYQLDGMKAAIETFCILCIVDPGESVTKSSTEKKYLQSSLQSFCWSHSNHTFDTTSGHACKDTIARGQLAIGIHHH
jgi:hypothetical protein